jgi:hypothetical protein
MATTMIFEDVRLVRKIGTSPFGVTKRTPVTFNDC